MNSVFLIVIFLSFFFTTLSRDCFYTQEIIFMRQRIEGEIGIENCIKATDKRQILHAAELKEEL